MASLSNDDIPFCRICHSEDGTLINICNCAGKLLRIILYIINCCNIYTRDFCDCCSVKNSPRVSSVYVAAHKWLRQRFLSILVNSVFYIVFDFSLHFFAFVWFLFFFFLFLQILPNIC